MCEFAVVAAAGPEGLTGREVVQGRRAYAEHLGVQPDETTQNSSEPNHVYGALKSPLPASKGKPRIDLGRATLSERDGRFFLLLDGAALGLLEAARPTLLGDAEAAGATLVRGIEIAWEAGIEQVPLDLDQLGIDSAVSETAQYIDRPAPGSRKVYRYTTTSKIIKREDGASDVQIYYAHANNLDIDADDSWWGYTSIVVRRDDEAGSARWNDDEDPDRGGVFTFRKAQWHLRVEDLLERDQDEDLERNQDEVEIAARKDLTPTDKYQQIKARRGQGIFREKVLEREPYCRLTGVDDPRHLRASHIQPWAVSNDVERLDANNGLMLSPHIDHLFDKADISFENDGTLMVLNEEIGELLVRWGVDLESLPAPTRCFQEEQIRFLEKHRERFRVRQSKQ